MNILVISRNYPSEYNPNNGAFVYNLMQELGKDHKITIISPNKLRVRGRKNSTSYGNEICNVYRPGYLSLSNRQFFGVNTGLLTSFFYKKAVQKVLKKLSMRPDLIYVHFLSNIEPILTYGLKEAIPIVAASGESTYTYWLQTTSKKTRNKIIENLKYLICVSHENSHRLQDMGFTNQEMVVIPNAVDYSLFKPLDKASCKEKLSIPKEKFTVGFIGHFINRKGPNRVIEAIRLLNDKDIHLICVGGEGDLLPNDFTTEINPVPNYQLPEIYNAFDIFVLPTLHEGSCNVIEEAKACGIPIVSSKGTSVEEQVDESIGILVDPMNIQEIAQSIAILKRDKRKLEMMRGALLNMRGQNSIQERAKKIKKIFDSVVISSGVSS